MAVSLHLTQRLQDKTLECFLEEVAPDSRIQMEERRLFDQNLTIDDWKYIHKAMNSQPSKFLHDRRNALTLQERIYAGYIHYLPLRKYDTWSLDYANQMRSLLEQIVPFMDDSCFWRAFLKKDMSMLEHGIELPYESMRLFLEHLFKMHDPERTYGNEDLLNFLNCYDKTTAAFYLTAFYLSDAWESAKHEELRRWILNAVSVDCVDLDSWDEQTDNEHYVFLHLLLNEPLPYANEEITAKYSVFLEMCGQKPSLEQWLDFYYEGNMIMPDEEILYISPC